MKIKTLKASVLGILLIAVSLYVIITSTEYNTTFIGGLLIAGASLLFVPDKFINQLEKFILGKEIKIKLPFIQSDEEDKK